MKLTLGSCLFSSGVRLISNPLLEDRYFSSETLCSELPEDETELRVFSVWNLTTILLWSVKWMMCLFSVERNKINVSEVKSVWYMILYFLRLSFKEVGWLYEILT